MGLVGGWVGRRVCVCVCAWWFGGGKGMEGEIEIQERFICQTEGTEDRKSATCIKQALFVYDHIFKNPTVRDIVLAAERHWLDESPFKGISKLHAVVGACKQSPSKLEWVFTIVVQRCKVGTMDPGEFSIRNMTGRANKQYVDVILKQRELKTFFAWAMVGHTLHCKPHQRSAARDLRVASVVH